MAKSKTSARVPLMCKIRPETRRLIEQVRDRLVPDYGGRCSLVAAIETMLHKGASIILKEQETKS
jgi:hypothetical protein